MGCVTSKVENEETVARCKARKRFMKQAVSARHAFAVAHLQYLQSLVSTGAAVHQFGEGGDDSQERSQEQRKLKQLRELDSELAKDKADDQAQRKEDKDVASDASAQAEQQPASGADATEKAAGDSLHSREVHPVSVKGRILSEVFKDLEEQFTKAAECGDQMSRMLETRKVHYLSSLSENKGHSENSRVFNSYSTFFSRSASSKALLSAKATGEESLPQDECGAMGSHAATLDRLFAWEKKLFDEVKGAEIIRVELSKKVMQLRHQEARGEDPVSQEKTRAVIKSLQTRVMVAFQAVDGASTKIQELRDEELYLQLLELLEGMTGMWKGMLECHLKQKALVTEIESLGHSGALELTKTSVRQLTQQLEAAVTKWQAAFNAEVASQKEYMSNLNGWLRLSMMQAVSEEVEAKDKTPKAAVPPIFTLCQEWQQALDRLPYAIAVDGITNFVGIVRTIIGIQAEEQRTQKRKEATEKELDKKTLALNNYEKKYVEPWIPPPTSDSDEKSEVVEEGGTATVTPTYAENSYFTERKNQVEALRKRLEEEEVNVGKAIQDTRSVTLSSIQSGLPQVFGSLATFASICSQTYDALHAQGLSRTSKFALLTDK